MNNDLIFLINRLSTEVDNFNYAIFEDKHDELIVKITEITEKFTIEFSKWLIKKCDFQKHGVWLYKGMEMTQEELLEAFKHDVE